MSMMKLAFLNFKNSFKNYLSLVISLAFTVLVLFNFQNLIDSEAFAVLGTRNKEYVEIIVQMVSVVLGCFMFFFIWYSTNVFLARRKKEIGVYVFMGLSNERIGKMYFIETTLIGVSALAFGLAFGALSAGLFQMILLAISDLAVEIQFRPGIRPIVFTAAVYGVIYMIFVVKGYGNIVRSSVLSMILATKQNESVRQNGAVLFLKATVGVGILCKGYSLALEESHATDVMVNALAAVGLVIGGVYLLFGGLIPLLAQSLAKKKTYLYQKQRILWVNSVIFRMKKNYRTYAMVSVLMLCSVTALATSVAMKDRYHMIIRFENTYTFQLLSSRDDLDGIAQKAIEEESEIVVSARLPMLGLDPSLVNAEEYFTKCAVLSFSHLKNLAKKTGMELEYEELKEDEVIRISHPVLMSFITKRSDKSVDMGGKTYRQIDDMDTPYLGYLQESVNFYVVNDKEYQRLLPMGEENYIYNYRIGDPQSFAAARDRLDRMIEEIGEAGRTGRVAVDPKSNELDWIKVFYSICIFMFLVFIMAGGSIMFMKMYNDALEEKERYRILMRMGFDRQMLEKSIRAELGTFYGVTFVVMGISSFFSVGALGKMMHRDLTVVNAISVASVLGILAAWYLLSVWAYERNVGMEK